MSFLKSLGKFFGFDQQPAGQWPRRVASWELPPERQPILPSHLREPLPPGVREVTGADHQGWKPWSPRSPQPPHRLRDPDLKRMDDFLLDGAVFPPTRKD
jgi:hypothetical protein